METGIQGDFGCAGFVVLTGVVGTDGVLGIEKSINKQRPIYQFNMKKTTFTINGGAMRCGILNIYNKSYQPYALKPIHTVIQYKGPHKVPPPKTNGEKDHMQTKSRQKHGITTHFNYSGNNNYRNN